MNAAKKTLCLMIVSIMALGMTQLAGASRFTDSDKISYNEAVDVLTGIGVFSGFPDGSFAPLENVSRAQAATILVRMLLGKSNADALPDATTGFPDVDGVSGVGYAKNYISYCVSHNIVVGHPDGTFRPNDPVTASQFAVMLMRALKIGDPSQFVGAEWETYAILYATENNILTTNVGYRLPANREQAAVYAFNALLYSPSKQTAMIAQDSLAFNVYPSLKKDIDGIDSSGNPGIVWTYGTPAVVIFSNVASGGSDGSDSSGSNGSKKSALALIIGFDSKPTTGGGNPLNTYTARIVDIDGVASTVPTTAAIFNESGRDAKYRGVVCSYTVASDGLYSFTAPAASAPGEYLIDKGISGISKSSTELIGGKTVKFADDTTKFVVVSYSGSGSTYSPSGSVSVYTGINKVPQYSLLTRASAVSLKSGSGKPDEIAEIVYIYDDTVGAGSETYVFVPGTWTQTVDGIAVNIIEKGVHASVMTKDATERDKLIVLSGLLLKNVKVTSAGIVTSAEVVDDNWDAQSSIHNTDGILVLDGISSDLTVADDVPVYTITIPASGSKEATVSTKSAVTLKTAITLAPNDFAYLIKSDDVVTSIYIIAHKASA